MVVVFLGQKHRRLTTALHEVSTPLTMLQQESANDESKCLDYRYTISHRVVQTNEEGKHDVASGLLFSAQFPRQPYGTLGSINSSGVAED